MQTTWNNSPLSHQSTILDSLSRHPMEHSGTVEHHLSLLKRDVSHKSQFFGRLFPSLMTWSLGNLEFFQVQAFCCKHRHFNHWKLYWSIFTIGRFSRMDGRKNSQCLHMHLLIRFSSVMSPWHPLQKKLALNMSALNWNFYIQCNFTDHHYWPTFWPPRQTEPRSIRWCFLESLLVAGWSRSLCRRSPPRLSLLSPPTIAWVLQNKSWKKGSVFLIKAKTILCCLAKAHSIETWRQSLGVHLTPGALNFFRGFSPDFDFLFFVLFFVCPPAGSCFARPPCPES